MKKYIRYILLFIVIGLLIWVVNYVQKALPIANGYNAKMLCSCVFVAERKEDACLEEDLSAYSFLKREIDYTQKRVSSSLWGFFKVQAVYRDQIGCSIYNESSSDPLVEISKKVLPNTFSDTIDYPYGNRIKTHPNVSNIDYTKLKEALDFAFDEPFEDKKRGTRAVLIVKGDSIIAERYANGFDQNTKLIGWSMTKSLVNAMIGILVKDGLLTTGQNQLFDAWKDERKNITIDDLLKMSSGLYFEEEYSKSSLATQMLFNSYSVKQFPIKQNLIAKPSENWYYASGTSNLLSALIQEKKGVYTFDTIYHRLIYKIGMNSMIIEPDASGLWVGSSFSYATARDWAKFGLLYLHDGIWNGERILPEGWVNYTRTPAPFSDSLQYGAHFWMNASLSADQPAKRWPELPNDLFYASGYQGQHVVIIPSLDMVIVRLGQYSQSDAWDVRTFLNKVVACVKK